MFHRLMNTCKKSFKVVHHFELDSVNLMMIITIQNDLANVSGVSAKANTKA
jgi:hypothetical protein